MTGSQLWFRRLAAPALLIGALCVPSSVQAQAAKTGDITTADTDCVPTTSCVEYSPFVNGGTVLIAISGAWSGGPLLFEFTGDGDEWYPLTVTEPRDLSTQDSTTINGVFIAPNVAFVGMRVRGEPTFSGTASVRFAGSTAASSSFGGGGGGSGGGGLTQFLEDDPASSGAEGMLPLAVRNASCGTSSAGANGDFSWFNQDANGNLCINIAANGVGSATDTDDGTVAGGQSSIALTIDIPYVWTGTELTRVIGPAWPDDFAFTPASNAVTPAGFFADEGSTDSVDEGDIGAGRMTLDRKQIVTTQPHSSGGLTAPAFISTDLDETEEDVSATPGQIYAIWYRNAATSPRYLRCYNATAANTTVGTTARVFELPMPANANDHISGFPAFGGQGVPFSTAISCAATTGAGATNTGAPGDNEVHVNVFYKN